MKLSTFIQKNQDEIMDEWVEYAQNNIKSTDKMELEAVRDHIKAMLVRIAENMETSQTESEQESKSKGKKDRLSGESEAAKSHGSERAVSAFDIIETSSEFRALRASVLRLWEKRSKGENWERDFHDMVRFNEAIDEAWMVSLQTFHKKVDEGKNWFLGVLGHDLRNPLAAISGVSSILKLSKNLSEKEKNILKRSDSSVKRMTDLIDNLLELTELRLGSGMIINKSTVDLSKQSEKVVQETQLAYPRADLVFESPGPIQGQWDTVRLDQLMTNLITNALRHGRPGGPVKITVSAEGNEAFFEVHNEGAPIPENIREMIFTGMFSKEDGDSDKKNSYGLGLYIVKEIVDRHNGEIKLTSTEEKGTTFTIMLPRH